MKDLFDIEGEDSFDNIIEIIEEIVEEPKKEAIKVSLAQFNDVLVNSLMKLKPKERISVKCHPNFLEQYNQSNLQSILPYAFNSFEDNIQLPEPIKSKLDTQSFLALSAEYDLDTRLLLDAYYHLNEAKFQNKPLADLIWEDATAITEKSLINFNMWSISVEDYINRKSLLSNAVTIYDKVGNQQSLTSKYINLYDVQNEESLSIELWNITKELNRARRNINSQLAIISKAWNRAAVVNYKKVYQSFIILKQDCDHFIIKYEANTPKKPGLLSFNKSQETAYLAYELLRKKLNELLQLSTTNGIYDSKLQKVESIHEILQEMENVNLALTSWEQNNNKKQVDEMERLSTLNSNNPVLKDAQKSIEGTVQSLNNLSISREKWECNTNSSVKHLLFIDNTIHEIEKILQIISQHEALMEKDRFMASLNAADQQFIKKFLEHPINVWEREFHKFFNPLLIRALYHPLTIIDDSLLNKIVENEDRLQQMRVQSLPTVLASIFEANVKELKQKNQKLYKQFFTNPNRFNKQDYYKSDVEILQSLFPIEFEKGVIESNEVIIINNYEGTELHFSLLQEDNKEALNKVTTPISSVHVTEQYSAANALATGICEYAKQINFYQLKTANIISVIPNSSPDIINNLLDAQGVKKLRPVHGVIESVKDSILSYERNQYLLIMNGLIDYTKPEEAINQKNIIKKFETAGYKIINIWSVDLMYDADAVFEQLARSLSGVSVD